MKTNLLNLDMQRYKELARQIGAEGIVMLKNDQSALPLKDGQEAAIFGRAAFNYFKSGTGSGGLVNTRYVTDIPHALTERGIELDKEVLSVYEEWIKENPFDQGSGWASEPWYQKEMPVEEGFINTAAARSDTAIAVIGRSAGEDRDNAAVPGSYYLDEAEKKLIEKVCAMFKKSIILLNVGNIIDMRWVEEYNPTAVLYIWQGGQEGGNAAADVLTGAVSPSGKLSDTIARNLDDYPSSSNFGGELENCYIEDIYVGYRFFETLAKDKVLYPFGFGLSYTEFKIQVVEYKAGDVLDVEVDVKNAGAFAGKEVVQFYVKKPQGALGKPALELLDFVKTKTLEPGSCQRMHMSIKKEALSSYDDSGVTGFKSSYVLEAGEYQLLVGKDIRSLTYAGSYMVKETIQTEALSEALAPIKAFERLTIKEKEGRFETCFCPVPLRTIDLKVRMESLRPADTEYTGDLGYKLSDVYDEKISMETFVNQLSNEELACITRGEGMCSPKVTPGTAGAFGGVTEALKGYGIPVGCCADGPSGIRMDCGTFAFSLPNGTAIGCSMNRELVTDLFEMVGLELLKNRIDTLLGPGMNLHRHPLNGRNFEYFSEDPLVTGEMAAAQLLGMKKAGVTGTVKHFIANNQEFHRNDIDSIVSERALRELYLKGFEIAVKKGAAYSIMSTYGAVNGIWTAGNYDLNTTILRGEWGFKGIVMTDWWAKGNEESEEPSVQNTAVMVRAQNDLFMVARDSLSNSNGDNLMEALQKKVLHRGELLRSAANICYFLINSPVMPRFLGREQWEFEADPDEAYELNITDMKNYEINKNESIDVSQIDTSMGSNTVFSIGVDLFGRYKISFKMRSDQPLLAQIPVSVFVDNKLAFTITFNGTGGEWIVAERELSLVFGHTHYIRLYFAQNGLELGDIKFERIEEV